MADSPGGERTEEATPRRLLEARRRGQIPRSRDLVAAVGLAATFLVLAWGVETGVGRLTLYLRDSLGGVPVDPTSVLGRGLREAALLLAAPLGAATLAALAVGFWQSGGLVTGEPLRLDLAKVNPSLERVFSVSALVEMLKALAVVVVVATVAWLTFEPLVRSLAALTGAGVGLTLATLGETARTLGLRLVVAAAALGALDFLWQRQRHLRALRMTREEVKREHKESEGDPHHRAERQRLHRELIEQRMIADVRKADFVVVNPDHIAVALRYDEAAHAAPVVVAKGERLQAEKIKEVAREAGVPIFRDVTLARSLRDLPEGEEIPEALYEAVAEILRVVHAPVTAAGVASAAGANTPASEAQNSTSGAHAPPALWRRA